MSRKTTSWIVAAAALLAPLAATAQEGEPYTLEAMEATNGILKAQWMDIRVEQVEVLSLGQARASSRIHRQPFRWVAGDTRRAADGNRLTYLVDLADLSAPGLASAQAEAAIDRAVATWASQPCFQQKVSVAKRLSSGADPDIFDSHFGYGGFGDWRSADVVLAGWLPPSFFEAVTGSDGQTILALSVTFIFVGRDGNPTDLDRDGYLDTAANEIYFNSGFDWSAGGGGAGMDVETVALHELGHSLGIGHIGPPPTAVMNPVYAGYRPELLPLDQAALCTIWGAWPH